MNTIKRGVIKVLMLVVLQCTHRKTEMETETVNDALTILNITSTIKKAIIVQLVAKMEEEVLTVIRRKTRWINIIGIEVLNTVETQVPQPERIGREVLHTVETDIPKVEEIKVPKVEGRKVPKVEGRKVPKVQERKVPK